MANLQYIGARYVPKLYENPDDHTNNWKSGVSYESLTIVTYLDDSYTSKIAVPASVGNPANNSNYWVKTGNFNASLIALQNELSTLENAVDILEIKPLSNVVFVGDSYGNYGWPEDLASFLGLDSNHYLKAVRSASGFTAEPSPSIYGDNGFLHLMHDTCDALPPARKNAISDVIILGGFNDNLTFPNAPGITKIQHAIRDCNNYVKTTFPNAQMHVGFVGYVLNGIRTDIPIADLMFADFGYNSGCAFNNVHYLSGTKYALPCLLDNLMQSDGFHPNALGCTCIAQYAALALKGAEPFWTFPIFVGTTVLSGTNINDLNVPFRLEEIDGRVKFSITSNVVAMCNSFAVTPNHRFTLGKFKLPRNFYFNQKTIIHDTEQGEIATANYQWFHYEFTFQYDECTIEIWNNSTNGNLANCRIPTISIDVDNYSK